MKYYYDRYWGLFGTESPRTFTEKTDISDTVLGYGYSGQAQYLNNQLFQEDHNLGPLPAGTYTISSIADDPRRGAHTCVLTPAATNEMYGRSGFLIHGDTTPPTHSASDGCIITPLWVRQQFKAGDEIVVF